MKALFIKNSESQYRKTKRGVWVVENLENLYFSQGFLKYENA